MKARWIVSACALLVALAATTAGAAPNPIPRRLAFHDEFNGAHQPWATCYPWWPRTSTGCTNEGNPDEQQWYVPSAVTDAPAALQLTATRTDTLGTFRGTPRVFSYQSGMVQSRELFSFQYGYVEFRMKLAPGQAMWDAAWLLPVRYDHRGEIDVFEAFGQYPGALALTYHTPEGGRYRKVLDHLPDLTAGFHTYGLDWQPTKLTWFLDGKAVYTVNAITPAEPMYLLMNLAVAGRFVSATTPPPTTSSAYVDYVRVWKR